ncbi:MAG: thioester-forming surface-anchored protein, partial [Lachnospiraceae bacterium]|nr:thioester-forming surface-anchored protein [Lachnospiraceae bacterium]
MTSMNRLAKKSLTASVLLTMILSLMPAINARADGGYTARAVPDKDFTTGGESSHISYAAFDISDQGATAAFCLNYGYVAPNASGVSGYTAKTVQPSSQNQAVDLLDKYAGSDSFQTAYWHGEDLYKKVMTVLYYGYKGDGSAKIIGDQRLSDQRYELYRIATQFAIWHYTDGKTTFGDLIKQKDAFFNKVTDNKMSSDDTIWAYQMYSKLIDDSLALPDGFYQNHELTVYVAPDWEIDKAKFKHWQNMISVRSIRDRKGKEFDFSKVDVNGSGSKELPGAQLSVKGTDDRGNKVDESWPSGTTAHRFKLYPGSYTMTETQAPKGFQTTTETVDFVVKEVDGNLKILVKKGDSWVEADKDKVVMKNLPTPTVVVSKQDLDSHAEIAGAQLQITGRSDNDEEIQAISWTSEAGKSHQVNLYFGVYTLEEKVAPVGYLQADSITFKVEKVGDGSSYRILIKKSDGSFGENSDGSKVVMLDKKNPNPPTPNSNSSSSQPNTPPNPTTPPTP